MSHTWSSKRKVRKAHKCWGCCSDILAGSVVEYSVTVDDGFWSAYWCNICQAVMDELEYWEKRDGFAYGDIKDLFLDDWQKAALENMESATTASNTGSTPSSAPAWVQLCPVCDNQNEAGVDNPCVGCRKRP